MDDDPAILEVVEMRLGVMGCDVTSASRPVTAAGGAQATVEATDADRCVVFQLEHGRLVPMASAGSAPPSWEKLAAAATAAMDKGAPITASGPLEGAEGGTIVAAPLVVQRGPAGALV